MFKVKFLQIANYEKKKSGNFVDVIAKIFLQFDEFF